MTITWGVHCSHMGDLTFTWGILTFTCGIKTHTCIWGDKGYIRGRRLVTCLLSMDDAVLYYCSFEILKLWQYYLVDQLSPASPSLSALRTLVASFTPAMGKLLRGTHKL